MNFEKMNLSLFRFGSELVGKLRKQKLVWPWPSRRVSRGWEGGSVLCLRRAAWWGSPCSPRISADSASVTVRLDVARSSCSDRHSLLCLHLPDIMLSSPPSLGRQAQQDALPTLCDLRNCGTLLPYHPEQSLFSSRAGASSYTRLSAWNPATWKVSFSHFQLLMYSYSPKPHFSPVFVVNPSLTHQHFLDTSRTFPCHAWL